MLKTKTYLLLCRDIFESAVWRDNPHVLKLWIYLFGNARYQKKPKKYPGFEVKRGELLTSLHDLAEDNEYMERGKLQRWSRAKVGRMLKVLEEQGYITLLADTYGTHISICNYNQYQDPKWYKADRSDTLPDTSDTGGDSDCNASENNSNKEKKGNKEKKETDTYIFILPDWIGGDAKLYQTWLCFLDMRIKIKEPMTGYAKTIATKKLWRLKEAGEEPIRVLEESIVNNWKSVFPVKNKQGRERTVEEKAALLP